MWQLSTIYNGTNEDGEFLEAQHVGKILSDFDRPFPFEFSRVYGNNGKSSEKNRSFIFSRVFYILYSNIPIIYRKYFALELNILCLVRFNFFLNDF